MDSPEETYYQQQPDSQVLDDFYLPKGEPSVEEKPEEKIQPSVEEQPKENIQPIVQEKPKEKIQPVVQEKPKENIQPIVQEKPKEKIQPIVQEKPKEKIQPVVQEKPKEKIQPIAQEKPKEKIQPVVQEKPKENIQPIVQEKPKEKSQLEEKPKEKITSKRRTGSIATPRFASKVQSSRASKSKTLAAEKKTKPKTGRKKQSPEEKKRKHREACDRWHSKWLSKGVPRPQPEAEEEESKAKKEVKAPKTSKSKENRVPKTCKEELKKEEPKKGDKKADKKDKKKEEPKHAKEIRDAIRLDNIDLIGPLPNTNDLRSTKGAWVKSFVANMTKKETDAIKKGENPNVLTNSQKYKLAVEGWMNSYLRSVLMSGKSKESGFAAIPASMLAVWVVSKTKRRSDDQSRLGEPARKSKKKMLVSSFTQKRYSSTSSPPMSPGSGADCSWRSCWPPLQPQQRLSTGPRENQDS